jgi:hypothetical protein
MEDELNALYEDVQEDFSTFYRTINEDDEVKFTAKLTPSEGRLDLNVNFYERGLFPPGAYHSEGHQDGMGVCLYLALMKRLFGERFTIALLDDVVMSVDSGHRYQFCKLLKTHFPNTQFVITTHDRLWAEQMRSAGLVTAKTSLAFHSWTVDTGPLVESNVEIWDEIAGALAKGKVEAAAAGLRHHLEYASRHLADHLGARPVFRADGNYELGELLPSVLSRMKELCGKAADAAQSWGNAAAKEAAIELIHFFEVLEAQMINDNSIGDRALTRFNGVPFNPDHPYNYPEAKRLIRLLRTKILRDRSLCKRLGIDFDVGGRTAITDGSVVWDYFSLRGHPKGKGFTFFPHMTFAIGPESAAALISRP